jgi:alkylhydroperoxidase family enzyme
MTPTARMVTDADIGTLRRASLSEDQIYEIVVCAAIGQATRQYQNALAALSTATGRN